MFKLSDMERCLFIKGCNGVLSLQVSERLYTEIVNCLEISEKQLTDIFRQVGTDEVNILFPESEVSVCGVKEEAESVFVKDRDYFRKIGFSNIRWIEASGSYCCLYLEQGPKVMLSFNLRELAMHLPERIFVRVHRSYMVNIHFIDSFIGNILCVGEKQIPVSKQHKRNVIARLNVLGNVK